MLFLGILDRNAMLINIPFYKITLTEWIKNRLLVPSPIIIRLSLAADRNRCRELQPNIRWELGNPMEKGEERL